MNVPYFNKKSFWVGDLWGGTASMLVALPSSIAFGVLVYSTLGSEYVGAGALAGIIGAASLGLIAPLVGRTSGLISAPCAPAAAVLSSLTAGLIAGNSGLGPADIIPLMALTALISALFQILYGAVGGGRLIKFVPYPVISGYLSGVGLLIAISQLPNFFSLPKGTPLLRGLISPDLWDLRGLAVGLIVISLILLSPRITRKAPAAIIGLFGGMLTYFLFALVSPGLFNVSGNPLIIGALNVPEFFLEDVAGRLKSLFSFDLVSFKLIIVPAITLSILLSIDTLKTCVVLDVLSRKRHNSDRELIGQGIGNLASFLCGGIPGAGTMGPTLVNISSGGKTPRSGVIEGALVILTLFLFSRIVAWVPISALAAILLVIAWRMFDWRSMLRLLRSRAGRLDFAVIAGVIVVAVTVDLIAASLVGVALAILLFIRDQVQWPVIHAKRGLDQVSSKTIRPDAERAILKQHGSQAVICELEGNLFFGTADQLFSQLEEDLRTKRFILLDMRRVQSMDYTAAHLFEEMQDILEEHRGRLLFTGMPSGLHDSRNFEGYLAQLGIVREGCGIIISQTMDSALEWMEDRILEEFNVVKKTDELPIELKDFDLFSGLNEDQLKGLADCVSELSVREGQRMFSAGDRGDELYLVRRGSVRVLLPLKGKIFHHLATVERGDFFGEVSFLDRSPRSTDIEAKTAVDLYIISRLRFNEHSRSDPVLGVQVFARLALTLAKRLRHTDAEVQVLEER
ncbi:MAG: SLC26A/SulP transporter family protein [Deltaproteobacteria bacterium]|nr:SLC26A/SulP transporter family protein [Deltaproteobacteria bacterium]